MIADKLINTLNQDFPAENLEIIVASDSSSDHTDEIVREFANRGVILVRCDHRGGKEHAQRCALKESSGDIIVFSDVDTRLEPAGVSRIASNFSDPTIGCVSSHDIPTDREGRFSGEGLYVRYEMFLRRIESRVNSLVGLSGSFFAARECLCQDIEDGIDIDFQIALDAMLQGYRAVIDVKCKGYYQMHTPSQYELSRKTRTVLRGMTVLRGRADILKPWKHGLFSLQLISHKILRWLTPLFLLMMLISSIFLALDDPIFRIVVAIQAGAYALGAMGLLSRGIISIRFLKLFSYLIVCNVGILVAWSQFFIGKTILLWDSKN